MDEQIFTEAMFKIRDGLISISVLKQELQDQYRDNDWEPIEAAVSLNIGLLESLFEDTEGVITYFVFETNFGEVGRESPWEDTNGTKWYFEHPIDVYDYFS